MQKEYIPSSAHKKMPITWNERIVSGSYAALNGVGITGLLSTVLAYVITPVASAGLGVVLGSAGLYIIAAAGIVSVLLTIPLAYMGYKSFLSEVKRHQEAFHIGDEKRKKNKEKLFFEMLRLRSLCANENEFEHVVMFNEGVNNREVKLHKLLNLVNRIYNEYKDTKYGIEWKTSDKNPVMIEKIESNYYGRSFAGLMKDFHIATNDDFRKELLSHIKNNFQSAPEIKNKSESDFDSHLNKCFKPVEVTGRAKRMKAAVYGLLAGTSVASAALGTGWTFAGMIIAAGLTLSIPVVGWLLGGIVCIALGVVVGLAVGLCKQKNVDRDALNQQLIISNEKLKSDKKDLTNACLRQRVATKKLKDEQREVNHDNGPGGFYVVSPLVEVKNAHQDQNSQENTNTNTNTNTNIDQKFKVSLSKFSFLRPPTCQPKPSDAIFAGDVSRPPRLSRRQDDLD